MPKAYWMRVAILLALLCFVTITIEQYVTMLFNVGVRSIVTAIFAFLIAFFAWCFGMVLGTICEHDTTYPARSARTLRILRSIFCIKS